MKMPRHIQSKLEDVEQLVAVIDRVKRSQVRREKEAINNIEALICISGRRKKAMTKLVTALQIENATHRLTELLQLEEKLLRVYLT